MGTITGAGVAGHDTIGVAWGAVWIACNAINQGVGPEFDNDVITAFEWFADPDGNPSTIDDVPDVVQNSWGINEGFGYDYTDCDSRWWDAIDNCEASGVVVTFSAGNEGPGPHTLRSPADRITTPTNAFAIGAIDATNYSGPPWPIASWSSRGPSGCDGVTKKPEVAAPGVDVYSAYPGGGYTYMSGTSMAGPHVAGVVALMREANPDLDVDTIKQILMDTAIDHGPAGEDNDFGWGVIDAYEAVLACMTGFGTLAGTVTNETNGGTPVEGATIEVIEADRSTTSQEDGTYSLSIPGGTYTVTVSHPSFQSETVYNVEIEEGETTILDFSLTDIAAPEIANTTRYHSTEDETGPYVIETTVTDYSNIDYVHLVYRVNGGAPQVLPMAGPSPDNVYTAGIPGQPQVSQVDYYIEARDIGGLTSTDPEGAPDETYRFYVAPRQEFFADDIESGQGDWTHEAGSPGFGDQWHISTQRNHTPGGTSSWKCGDTGSGDYGNLLDAVLLTPPVELGIDSYLDYWQWMDAETSNAYSGYAYDGGLVELNDGSGWVQIYPDEGYTFKIREGSTPGPFPQETLVFSGHRDWHEVHFDLSAWENQTVQIRFRFGTDGAVTREGWYVDDVVVDGFFIDPQPAGPEPMEPSVLRLLPVQPTPASGPATLRFALPSESHVLLQVFDPSGRLVGTLVDGHRNAGLHSVQWSGCDASGRPLGSGVYLVRLKVDNEEATTRIVVAR